MRKQLAWLVVVVGAFGASFVVSTQASAATLANVSDRVSTSRPSPSTPVNQTAASGVGSLTIFNNKSRFLASDSAMLINGGTGGLLQNIIIASQSADYQTAFFTTNTTTAVNATTVLAAPITAMHTIQFQTVNAIPASGKIAITFPGGASNIASPSATTFSFNGMTSGGGLLQINGTSGGSWNVTAPTITYTLGATPISAGTTITILVGCTAQSGGSCTSASPRLINPTKTAALGTADLWTVNIATQDSSSNVIDTGKARIGTQDVVNVQATVDPSLTFTITGIPDNINLNSDGTYGVGSSCSDTTNSGVASSATDVNLGFLTNGTINIAAQQLSVSTNAANGYAITATSSGKFINPATGYWIKGLNSNTNLSANDTPAPATFGASGTEGFGISPCGPRVNTTTWGTGATAFSSGAKYSNPYNTGLNSFYATLASYTGTGGVSNDKTNLEYAASISGTTPAGVYSNYFTYIATATF